MAFPAVETQFESAAVPKAVLGNEKVCGRGADASHSVIVYLSLSNALIDLPEPGAIHSANTFQDDVFRPGAE